MDSQPETNHNDIRQRLLETIVVLEEYTPKLQKVDDSLNNFQSTIKNQKTIIKDLFGKFQNESEEIVSNVSEKSTRSLSLLKKSSIIFYSSILIFSFICGFTFAFHYSEKFYFSDHRYKRIQALENESFRIRNQYYSDLNLIEKLRNDGCVITETMMLAPKKIVKNSGLSDDDKFIGVWFND